MQYCIYLRKSRKDLEAEAHGEGETLARHERLLLEVAKKGNYNVTEIYREIVSGDNIASRPMMQRLLQEVDAGMWTGVLVVEIERLARGDTIDQGIMAQAFKYSGTKIITPAKVYDPLNEFDEEYFEFNLFMSRREYKTINRRLQRGRDASCKEGKYISAYAPYGYRKCHVDNGKGVTLEIDSEKAAIVKYIFELFVNGESLPDGSVISHGINSIAAKLVAMGIEPPGKKSHNNSDWHANTIRRILINPVYTGKVRWRNTKRIKKIDNGVISEKIVKADESETILANGIHPAIVSESLFKSAQELLSTNAHVSTTKSSILSNPLSGLVKCGICGRSLSRNGSNYLECQNHACSNMAVKLVDVENKLISELSKLLDNYRLSFSADSFPADNSADAIQAAIVSTESELKKLKTKLSAAYDLVEDGTYDRDTFLSRSRLLSEKITSTEDALANLRESYKSELHRIENQNNVIPKIEKILEIYPDLPSCEVKNKLLKSILGKVEVIKTERSRKNNHDNFSLTIFPKIPIK